MIRSATVFLLVYAILLVTLTSPVTAQQRIPTKQPVAPAEKENSKAEIDLKTVFDRQTASFKADSAGFDPVKAERENAQSQSQKKGWSKTKKTLVITAVVVGIAALTFLLIKYYKKCIRYQEGCDPFSDEYCPCEEYEERK